MNINDLQRNFLAGQWLLAQETNQPIKVFNPATQSLLGYIPRCHPDHIDHLVTKAQESGQKWRKRSSLHRANILMAWAQNIQSHAKELAHIITLENGKPLKESKAEVFYTASFVRWFAEEARRIRGEIIPANTPNTSIQVTYEPVGVCALITPWNFPAAMLGRKLAAALAAGCSAICKPAEETPFSAIRLIQLAIEAGLPADLVSVITGDPASIGQKLCADARVRKISFTGSSEVGRLLMAQSAPNLKRLSLELGGNAPLIIFEDADIGESIDGIMASKFRNAGQTCIASNRILVHHSKYNDLIKDLCPRVQALSIGDGLNPQTDIGPLISKDAVRHYHARIEEALSLGAQAHTVVPSPSTDHFVEPVILSHIQPTMRVWKEEIFGPLIGIRCFTTEEEAIDMANDTEAGLAAYLFSKDAGRIERVSHALEYGMVGVNTGRISMAQVPFGGVKQSGFGREGSHHGIDEYLQLKYRCIQQ